MLPRGAREALGVVEGNPLRLTIDEPGVLRVTAARAAVDLAMGLLAPLAKGRSLADELIAERRGAAAR